VAEREPETNIEIIWADWVDAIRRGDIERLAKRISPETVHRGVRPELICRNGAEVVENARSASEQLPQVEAIELIAAGDHVVLGIRAPDIGPEGEQGQVFIVFTLRDGLIVEIQDYVARHDALTAAGTSDPSGWR
jgi:ketosteroid isomerase-like protein